jgi:putative oxidoreductase
MRGGLMSRLGSDRMAPAVDPAAFLLRVAVGAVFAYHGYQKLDGGVANFAAFVESESIPLPDITAWAVTLLELGGGVLLVIGLGTRLWGLLLALQMIGTTLLIKTEVGLIAPPQSGAGAELDLVLLAAAGALVLLGPGRYSVDATVGLDRRAAARRPVGSAA